MPDEPTVDHACPDLVTIVLMATERNGVCPDCGGPRSARKVRCRTCWKIWNRSAGPAHPLARPTHERWRRTRKGSPEHMARVKVTWESKQLHHDDQLRADVGRFMAKVDPWSDIPCWTWKGPRDRDGYGVFNLIVRGNNVRAHHFALLLATGVAVPKGATVMHNCDTPGCVYPGHLRVGTPAENIRDCIAKGRSARGERHWSRTRPEEFKAHMARMHAAKRCGRGE
jgi:hypothetical protein